MSRFLLRFVSTGFFFGLAPIFPGTVGSLAGFLVWGMLRACGWDMPYAVAVGSAVFLVAGVPMGTAYEKAVGRTDPREFVWDEFVGVLMTLAPLSFMAGPDVPMIQLLLPAVAGCAAFRFFDIVKPFPIEQSQRLRGGAGMMVDDALAAVPSAAVAVAVFVAMN